MVIKLAGMVRVASELVITFYTKVPTKIEMLECVCVFCLRDFPFQLST